MKIHAQNYSTRTVPIPAKCMLGELYRVDEIHTLSKHVSNNTSQNTNNIEHVAANCDSIDKVAFLKLFKFEDISGISSSEFQQLQNLLLEFHDVFSTKHDTDIGKTSLVKHQINLTDNTAIKIRHRRIPPSMVDEVRQHLRDMLACVAIRESKSPLLFPTDFIRKRAGTLIFCIDFRDLNRRIARNSHHLPKFYEVEMEEAHKECTAFSVGSLGFWECNSMLFWLTNAPSTFQRVLEQCMSDQKCLLYITEIVLFSKTTSEHFQYIKDVFRIAGMKLKPSVISYSVVYITWVILFLIKEYKLNLA